MVATERGERGEPRWAGSMRTKWARARAHIQTGRRPKTGLRSGPGTSLGLCGPSGYGPGNLMDGQCSGWARTEPVTEAPKRVCVREH